MKDNQHSNNSCSNKEIPETDYQRISCDYYDYLEMYAIQKQQLILKYKDAHNQTAEKKIQIKTLETKNKEEFMISTDGMRLRLDKIISLTPISNLEEE